MIPFRLALPCLVAAFAAGVVFAQGKAPAAKTRTRPEIEALIDKEGRTPPAWWKKVTLNYPRSLDLSWPEPAPPGPWDAQKNVGQFIWSVINENPPRWQEGPKFITHLMTVNKDDPRVVLRCMDAMGRMYHNLLEDYPRAAFWWRKADSMDPSRGANIDLADCYWKLGCREMAEEILAQFSSDGTRHGAVVKLWADMGETDKAVKLGEEMAAQGRPDIGFLVAGDACRLAGRYEPAMDYYRKAAATTQGTRDLQRNVDRARASLEAVQLFDALDLKRVPNGTFVAESLGYEAPIEVEVTVAGRKIVKVEVSRHKEKQFYSALTDTPRRILDKQSVKGVDATTGATITSEAIINATAKALGGKGKKK